MSGRVALVSRFLWDRMNFPTLSFQKRERQGWGTLGILRWNAAYESRILRQLLS
jgi:hypothetical protein